MEYDTTLVKISCKAESIVRFANAAYWATEKHRKEYLESQVEEVFLELAEIMGYKVSKN